MPKTYNRKSHIIKCIVCGKEKETKSFKAKFCSNTCRQRDFALSKPRKENLSKNAKWDS